MPHDSRRLRNALGCFTTGVCVVTTDGGALGAVGLTINSFASVSLEPPLILWSLDRASDRLAVFETVTHFGINVLSHEAVEISHRLARKGEHKLGADEVARLGAGGVPVLKNAHAHFECEVVTKHDGGDHIIFVGKVIEFAYDEACHPLVYYRGRYRGLAPLDE